MKSNIEIERKFLVKGVLDLSNTPFTIIEQYYLPTALHTSTRVRLAYNSNGVLMECTLTIKSPPDVVRTEIEKIIPIPLATELIRNAISCVRKRRYVLIDNGLTFEVDVFKDTPLTLIEVELSDRYQPFVHPGWLGLEVTGNPSYYNENLAKEI